MNFELEYSTCGNRNGQLRPRPQARGGVGVQGSQERQSLSLRQRSLFIYVCCSICWSFVVALVNAYLVWLQSRVAEVAREHKKKVPFWVKNSVSLARSALLHGIYCIFH